MSNLSLSLIKQSQIKVIIVSITMEDYLKKWKVSMDAIRQAKETGLARQAECSIAKGSQVVEAVRPREAKKLTKETKRQMKM